MAKKDTQDNGIFITANDYFDWSRAKEFLTQNKLADIEEAAKYIRTEVFEAGRGYSSYGNTDSWQRSIELLSAIPEPLFYNEELWDKAMNGNSEVSAVMNTIIQSEVVKDKGRFVESMERATLTKVHTAFLQSAYYQHIQRALLWSYKLLPQANIANFCPIDWSALLKNIETHYDDPALALLKSVGLQNFQQFKKAIDTPLTPDDATFLLFNEKGFISLYQQAHNLDKHLILNTVGAVQSAWTTIKEDEYRKHYQKKVFLDFLSDPKINTVLTARVGESLEKQICQSLLSKAFSRESYHYELPAFSLPLLQQHFTREDLLQFLDQTPTTKDIGPNQVFLYFQNLHQKKSLCLLTQADFQQFLEVKLAPNLNNYVSYFNTYFDPEKFVSLFAQRDLNEVGKYNSFYDELSAYAQEHTKYLDAMYDCQNPEVVDKFLHSFFAASTDEVLTLAQNLPKYLWPQFDNVESLLKNYAKRFLSDERDLPALYKNPDLKHLLKNADFIERALTEGWGGELFIFASLKYKTIAQDEILNDLFLKNLSKESPGSSYLWSEYAENPKALLHNPAHTARLCNAFPLLFNSLSSEQWKNVEVVEEIITGLRKKYSASETLIFLKTKASFDVRNVFQVLENNYITLPTQERAQFDVLSAYKTIIAQLHKATKKPKIS